MVRTFAVHSESGKSQIRLRTAHAICIASSEFASVVYEQHNFRHNLTSDLIVTLTLGIGTQLLCATYLLIKFYLSVKFHQICFSSFLVIAETQF